MPRVFGIVVLPAVPDETFQVALVEADGFGRLAFAAAIEDVSLEQIFKDIIVLFQVVKKAVFFIVIFPIQMVKTMSFHAVSARFSLKIGAPGFEPGTF